MGMLLRRYHEDTPTQEVKPTTYAEMNDNKGVAEKVAPFVKEDDSDVKVAVKPKKATTKKK